MADSHAVNVGYRSEQLISIKFNVDIRHVLLLFHVILHHFVQGVWDMLHDDVQVDFIVLVPICVKVMFHFDAKRML